MEYNTNEREEALEKVVKKMTQELFLLKEELKSCKIDIVNLKLRMQKVEKASSPMNVYGSIKGDTNALF